MDEDLADTLAFWREETGYGRGIAAPQIGANVRVIFLRLPGEEAWPIVKPVITERSAEKIVVWDGCQKFLSIFMQVERHREIAVRYQDLRGSRRKFTRVKSGIFRNCCKHESITCRGFWRWIGSGTFGRCARARSSRRDFVQGVPMHWEKWK